MSRHLSFRTEGGFANRLRAIVSAVLWAEDLGCELSIYWPVEPGHMPCRLVDLFEPSSIPRLKTVYSSPLSSAKQVLTHEAMKQLVEKEGLDIRIESYAEFHIHQRSARGLTILRGIRVKGVFEAEADRVWSALGGTSEWLGVHYRGTDHTHCIAASPLVSFIPVLSQAKGIFLCSDEPAVKEWFKAQFFVKSIDVEQGRMTPNQQRQAIIEWLLLHKCSRVLQSAGTSFSELATLRSGGILIKATLSN